MTSAISSTWGGASWRFGWRPIFRDIYLPCILLPRSRGQTVRLPVRLVWVILTTIWGLAATFMILYLVIAGVARSPVNRGVWSLSIPLSACRAHFSARATYPFCASTCSHRLILDLLISLSAIIQPIKVSSLTHRKSSLVAGTSLFSTPTHTPEPCIQIICGINFISNWSLLDPVRRNRWTDGWHWSIVLPFNQRSSTFIIHTICNYYWAK